MDLSQAWSSIKFYLIFCENILILFCIQHIIAIVVYTYILGYNTPLKQTFKCLKK